MMELGAHLHAADKAKNEQESCAESKKGCEKDLEGVEERIERNEARVRFLKYLSYVLYNKLNSKI